MNREHGGASQRSGMFFQRIFSRGEKAIPGKGSDTRKGVTVRADWIGSGETHLPSPPGFFSGQGRTPALFDIDIFISCRKNAI